MVWPGNRDYPSDSRSIQIKQFWIEIVLIIHTMEINPYVSKSGSETV